MVIIPAIDLMDGRCVRLVQGDFSASTIYDDDPVNVAAAFEEQGVRRLHLVDLDGARTGTPVHYEVLRSIKRETDLVVDFGGGIRDESAVEAAFDAGADQISVGSVAVKQVELLGEWVSSYGSDRLIFAADARAGMVTASGWMQTTAVPIERAIERTVKAGIRFVLATDVGVDGTMEGPALSLYSSLRSRFPEIYLIASGGVGSADDIRALEPTGVDAVIVGRAIYEGKVQLSEFV